MSGLRVFVVDDEHTIADTTTKILKNEGFEASAIYSGEAAVRLASIIRPHVLVGDVMMPGMNGIEASMQIRHTVSDCRVILITAQIGSGGSSNKLRTPDSFLNSLRSRFILPYC